ncbi:zinc-dependent metalloprotease [Bacteroidota bacterium]
MKKTVLFLLPAIFFIFLNQTTNAQAYCRTPDVSINLVGEQEFNEYVELFKQEGGSQNKDVKYIPTVIHIIYRNAADSIKMSMTRIVNVINQCNIQMRRLNADTANTRIEFKHLAVDSHIQVCLATKKPNQSTFSGVMHYYMPNWDRATDYALFVANNMLDRTKYLNVFVTPEEEYGGAVFPWDATETSDGFFIGSDLFGVYEPDMADWGIEGTTFTHELIHYLGVYHTNHDSQGLYNQCEWDNDSLFGDRCGDTPFEWDDEVSADRCDEGHRECFNTTPHTWLLTQTENYMFYNKDSCTNMISNNQRSRMRASLSDLRAELVSLENNNFTGIACANILSVNDPAPNEPALDKAINIYPNPAKNHIQCQFQIPNSKSSIWIYDMFGGLENIVDVPQGKGEVQIDVSNYASGIYIAVLKSEKDVVGKKRFIKQ